MELTRDGSPRSLIVTSDFRGTTSSLRCILQEFSVFWNAGFFRRGAIVVLGRWGAIAHPAACPVPDDTYDFPYTSKR